MSTSSQLHNTQQFASAAETFVDVLNKLFPADTFDQLFHGDMVRRAFWTALQDALGRYYAPGKTVLLNGLMNGAVFAQPQVVEELLKLFLPGDAPNYDIVADYWAVVLPENEHQGLSQEAQHVLALVAEALQGESDLRMLLQQLVETRMLTQAHPISRGDDLNRLLDSALVAGPGTLSRQIRYLLAISADAEPDFRDDVTADLIALCSIAETLPADEIGMLADQVNRLHNDTLRVRLLGKLAPRLYALGLAPAPLTFLRGIFQEDDHQQGNQRISSSDRVDVLLNLAPYLETYGLDTDMPTFQQRVLAGVEAISDPASRVRALSALIPELSPEIQPEAVSMAFETAAQSIPSDMARATALSELPPHLPPEFHAALLSIAYELRTPDARAMLLSRMLPHLPDTFQAQAINAALVAIEEINGDEARAAALMTFAPNVDAVGSLQNFPDALQKAIAVTFSIERAGSRAQAFAALAPYLSPELLAEALQVVKRLDDDDIRARTLTKLAPHLPSDLSVAAFSIAHELNENEARALALSVIAPYLSTHARAKALADGLVAALAIRDRYQRVVALADLAPNLPDDLRRRALDEALTATRSIIDENERGRALVFLAPHLRDDQLADALADAYTIRHPLERIPVLSALMPVLPDEPRTRVAGDVLHLVQNGDLTPTDRASILAAFAPVLPENMVQQAIAAAKEIAPPYDRTHGLTALLPRRPQALTADAMAAARAVRAQDERVTALLELVPHTPPAARRAILDEILDTALQVRDEYDRASALAKLAPYVDMQADIRNQQQDVIRMALDACLSEPDPVTRAALLERLAVTWTRILTPTSAYPLWQQLAAFLRTQPYHEVLTDLAALGPALNMMGASLAVAEVADTLSRWVDDQANAPA